MRGRQIHAPSPPSADRAGRDERLDPRAHLGDQRVAVVDSVRPAVSTGSPMRTRHRHGPHDRAALAHGRPPAGDRHRHDRRLRLDRHDEPALLEGQELVGAAARALGKDQERVAVADRRGRRSIDGERLPRGARARPATKPPVSIDDAEDRQLAQLRLEEDVEPRDAAPGTAPAGRRCSGDWRRTRRRARPGMCRRPATR